MRKFFNNLAKKGDPEGSQTRMSDLWLMFAKRWVWKIAIAIVVIILMVLIGQTQLSGPNGKGNLLSKLNLGSGGSPEIAMDSAMPQAGSGMSGSSNGASTRTDAVYSPEKPSAQADRQSASPSAGPSKSVAMVPPISPIPPSVPPADSNLPRKMTHNLNATLQVVNIEPAVEKLTNLAQSMGGYIVDSQMDNQQDASHSYANVIIKVPADKFEGIPKGLADIGKVLNQHISTNDITNQYYDSDMRLKNWLVQEQRYEDILSKAKSVEEILNVESYLGNIRMQIEQLKGQMKLWEHEIAYSTIQVQLQTKPNPISIDEPWQPISWQKTWQATQNAVLKTISSTWNLLNYLVVGIGYALPLIILIGVGYTGNKYWRKKKDKNREKDPLN